MSENVLNAVVETVVKDAFPPVANAAAVIAANEKAASGTAPAETPTAVPTVEPSGAALNPEPTGFDPAIHRAGPDGKPLLNRDGSFRRINGRKPKRGPDGKFGGGGSKPGDNAGGGGAAPESGPVLEGQGAAATVAPAEAVTREAAMQAAQASVGLGISIAVAVFGTEWLPSNTTEAQGLVMAVGEYYYASQSVGLSPGWVAVAAIATYAAPRFQRPQTQSRIRIIWGKVRTLLRFGR